MSLPNLEAPLTPYSAQWMRRLPDRSGLQLCRAWRLHRRPDRRDHGGMSALTRRRDPAAHHETWLIHHGDVHIGTIRIRAGVPGSVDQWGWTCGFHPASHRGVSADGAAMSFGAAR